MAPGDKVLWQYRKYLDPKRIQWIRKTGKVVRVLPPKDKSQEPVYVWCKFVGNRSQSKVRISKLRLVKTRQTVDEN